MLSVLAPFLSWIKDGSLQMKQKQLWSCCLLEADLRCLLLPPPLLGTAQCIQGQPVPFSECVHVDVTTLI